MHSTQLQGNLIFLTLEQFLYYYILIMLLEYTVYRQGSLAWTIQLSDSAFHIKGEHISSHTSTKKKEEDLSTQYLQILHTLTFKQESCPHLCTCR